MFFVSGAAFFRRRSPVAASVAVARPGTERSELCPPLWYRMQYAYIADMTAAQQWIIKQL